MAENLNIRQTNLHLRYQREWTFENFIAGANQPIVDYLNQSLLGLECERMMVISAKESMGKTHLLQAVCHRALFLNKKAFYLPLQFHANLHPRVLDQLDEIDVICLDDFQFICGQPEWEEKIFYLFNQIQAKKSFLIISTSQPVIQLNITLPDLKSRILACLSLEIVNYTDEDKAEILKQEANHRGFTLSDECTSFLLQRYSRHMPDLFAALHLLDQMSLSQNRKVTIHFIKEVLGL